LQAEDIVAKGIGHAPEGRRIFARMSVRENLDLGAYIRRDGATRSDMERVYTLFPRLRERQASSPAPSPVASSKCFASAAP